jgi:hypothetical protein
VLSARPKNRRCAVDVLLQTDGYQRFSMKSAWRPFHARALWVPARRLAVSPNPWDEGRRVAAKLSDVIRSCRRTEYDFTLAALVDRVLRGIMIRFSVWFELVICQSRVFG